jgi:hypothetical protein
MTGTVSLAVELGERVVEHSKWQEQSFKSCRSSKMEVEVDVNENDIVKNPCRRQSYS